MPKLTIYRQVPESRTSYYEVLNWTTTPSPLTNGRVTMQKEVETHMSRDTHETQVLREPYLVQTGRIRRPLSNIKASTTLSESLQQDYMGSAEFEYGALPLSMRVVEASFPLYQEVVVPTINTPVSGPHGPRLDSLRLFSNFDSDEDLHAYVQWLRQAIDGKLSLKEPLRLASENRGNPEVCVITSGGANFWWDIRNHVFFSFDKPFMKKLPQLLQASFLRMNAPLT